MQCNISGLKTIDKLSVGRLTLHTLSERHTGDVEEVV